MRLVHIAYYITGHGFGHATRSIELMRGLLESERYRLTAVSSLDPAYFRTELTTAGWDANTEAHMNKFDTRHITLDTGGVQVDAIVLDAVRTLETYHTQIHCYRDHLLQTEVTWLQANKVDLVLVDSTPLACAAAKLAGIRAVLVSNLTWDYIFQQMLNDIAHTLDFSTSAKYQDTINQATKDSSDCSYLIRYPGFTPLLGTPEMQILPAPMLCRAVRNSNLRSELGIPPETKLLLLGFGGHAAEWDLKDEALPAGWMCLVLRALPSQLPSSRFRLMPQDAYVPDLINAADVVLGKIGYGFVSECLNAGTPLVFVPRVHWAEESYLQAFLDTFNAAIAMPHIDFKNGIWEEHLNEAYARKGTWTLGLEWVPEIGATARVVQLVDSTLPVLMIEEL